MGSKDLWPPLEEVREWAAGKIKSEKTQPFTAGRYQHLIAVIDEILATKSSQDSNRRSSNRNSD
jgi:hypothetical protein